MNTTTKRIHQLESISFALLDGQTIVARTHSTEQLRPHCWRASAVLRREKDNVQVGGLTTYGATGEQADQRLTDKITYYLSMLNTGKVLPETGALLDLLTANAHREVTDSELPEHSAGTKADEQAITQGLNWLATLINSPTVPWDPAQKSAARDDLWAARAGLRRLLYGDAPENAPNGR